MEVKGSDKKLKTASFGNLSWGMQFTRRFSPRFDSFSICPGVCDFALYARFYAESRVDFALDSAEL